MKRLRRCSEGTYSGIPYSGTYSHSSGGYVAVKAVSRPRDSKLLKLERRAILKELLEFDSGFLSVGKGVSRHGHQLGSGDTGEHAGDHIIVPVDVPNFCCKLGDEEQMVLLDR